MAFSIPNFDPEFTYLAIVPDARMAVVLSVVTLVGATSEHEAK